jgi:chromosome segregation ATPase
MQATNAAKDVDGVAPADTPVPPSAAAEPSAPLFTAEETKFFQTIVDDCNAFPEYERQHQEVLMTLESDEVLDVFRAEYEGLHNSLLHSHEGEGRLLRKCADLQSDIQACAGKVMAAAELSAGDRSTIAHLRQETERTSNRLVRVKEKESQLKEAVATLKREIAAQQAKAQEPVELPVQEAAFQSLRHLHETVQREEEKLVQQLRSTSFDVDATQRRIAALLESNTANELELKAVKDSIAAKEEETQLILSTKAAKEEELRAMRATVASRVTYFTQQQNTLATLAEDHERHGQELRETKREEARLAEEYQGLCRQLQHVNTALQECNEENDMWQRRAQERTAELQAQQAHVAAAHARYVKGQKVVEALQKRNAVVEQQKAEQHEKQRETLLQLKEKEAALALARQGFSSEEQTLMSIKKEVNLLQQNIAGEAEQQRRNAAWLAEKRGQLHMMEQTLTASEEHNQHTRQELYVVVQEAETHEADAKRYAYQCAHLLSDMESVQAELAQQESQLSETEAQIKQQQQLLESMVVERNTYTSHYDQLKHGLSEQQQHFGLLLAQIKTMKSAVQKREHDVKVETAHIQLLKQQQKNLDGQLTDYQRLTGKKHRTADMLVQELRQLRSVLSDAEEETARQQRRCRDVQHERDVLNRQVTDRSTELNMLYEKAHTQQSMLQRNEVVYADQARELEHLQYQTTQFAQQLAQMREFLGRLPELQVALNNATRELQREKVRVRSLLEEAERPLNVHPYHELASAEPETYALVQRVQKLQRVLLQRRQELETKEATIQEVEQSYMKSKAAVAHQPGPEIAEQLSAYQQNLVKKHQQMRQMQETLSFFRAQTDQFKARHDVLRERLADMGKEYATQRAEEERQARLREAGGGGGGESFVGQGDGGAASAVEVPVYRGFVAPTRPPPASDAAV